MLDFFPFTILDSITLADVAELVVTHCYDSEYSIDSDWLILTDSCMRD
jgi:hypothetical protein